MLKNTINSLTLVTLIIVIGCDQINQTTSNTKQPTSSGFVEEMDEPSVRGNLVRISPETNDLFYRFAVSPDGKNIVYAASQDESKSSSNSKITHLWKISINGGSPTKITSGGDQNCIYPCFSKDGKFVFYSSGGVIWKINSNGSGARVKIQGSGSGYDSGPHISKNGDIVFFSTNIELIGARTVEKSMIWICDSLGLNITQLREGSDPTWAPDGERIVFAYNDDIWIIKRDGTELTQLSSTPNITEGLPSFSEDGKQIIFTSNEKSILSKKGNYADFDIWKMGIDGSGKAQLTELKSWDSWPLQKNGFVYFASSRANKKGERFNRIWRIPFSN